MNCDEIVNKTILSAILSVPGFLREQNMNGNNFEGHFECTRYWDFLREVKKNKKCLKIG